MKGVGRRSLFLVILHDGNELVAAAKSAGLSPGIQVESYDTKYSQSALRRAFELRLKRSVVEFPRPAFLFWGGDKTIRHAAFEKLEE